MKAFFAVLALIFSLAGLSTSQNVTMAPTTAADAKEGLTVQCSSESIVAILDLVKYPNMDTDTMMLDDSSCKPATVNATHAVIKTPLDGCGTTQNSTDDYLNYYNNIRISRKKENSSSVITREHEATFPFQCAYNRKTVLSVVSFSPRRKLVYTSVADLGNFTFTMDMYESDQYKNAYESYPVTVALNQPTYLEVAAVSKDTNLVLFPERCFATPTSDVKDAKAYNFINKGCSKDDTLEYKYDKESSKQHFSIDAFRFVPGGPPDSVHLHCDVVVCRKSDADSVCAKGCNAGKSRRRRAAAVNLPREKLSIGPVNFAQVQSVTGAVKGPVSVGTVATIAGCLALVAMVLIVAIAIVLFRRRRGNHRGVPTLLVQDAE